MYTHTRPFISRKTTNHLSNDSFSKVGRQNKISKTKCFYCMKFGHTNNVCYYRKLHLNLLPMDYFESHKPRPNKVWVQKVMDDFLFLFLPLIDKLIKLIYLAYQ